MVTIQGFPVVLLPGPRGVRLVSTARLRDPVLNALIDTEEERRAIEEIESFSSGRLTAERRGTASIGAGEFVRAVPHAAFINASFAYFRPRELNRFNGPERGAWYASLTGTATCIAEIIWHIERELARIDRFATRIEYAELFASFAGEFVDLRGLTDCPACLHPDTAVGYAAGNALADAVRRQGVNGIVYPPLRDPIGTNLVALFPHAVQSVAQGDVLELRWEGKPGPIVRRVIA
ncbi:MAG: RES family NAD+ phosphorylase [Gammaproteobacteria bacterium]|uniref:RES family NAD+ phosphorylase n=1 Tax=Thalassobaculum sp. TaxID=2022740 RepID=UPI0032ED3FA7